MTTEGKNDNDQLPGQGRRWQFSLWQLLGLVFIAAYAATSGRTFGFSGASLIFGMFAGIWIGQAVTHRKWIIVSVVVACGVIGTAIGLVLDLAILMR
jgi:hypothetical protein